MFPLQPFASLQAAALSDVVVQLFVYLYSKADRWNDLQCAQ